MKSVFLMLFLFCVVAVGKAQYYDDVLTYVINDSTFNGVKIKTNLPYVSNSQMPTIMIEGYAEGVAAPINLTLVYFINSTGFIRSSVSTSGAYSPTITLAGENGKVVIFLDSKAYFQRLHVRAFASGRSGDIPANYAGWTAVDSALLSTALGVTVVPYQNAFAGNVFMPGGGVWNASGNVGIGTTSFGTYKLAVEGAIGARRVDVKPTGWADFVFQPDYQLPTLNEVERYISVNKHLPGIPSAGEVIEKGIDLGEMNKTLLQKVEELTLYLIDQNKKMMNQEARAADQEKRIQQLEAVK